MKASYSAHSNIRAIEQELEQIKMLHSLRKITHDAAKQEILRLETQLLSHVSQLPSHERQLYMIKKEFGKEF